MDEAARHDSASTLEELLRDLRRLLLVGRARAVPTPRCSRHSGLSPWTSSRRPLPGGAGSIVTPRATEAVRGEPVSSFFSLPTP